LRFEDVLDGAGNARCIVHVSARAVDRPHPRLIWMTNDVRESILRLLRQDQRRKGRIFVKASDRRSRLRARRAAAIGSFHVGDYVVVPIASFSRTYKARAIYQRRRDHVVSDRPSLRSRDRPRCYFQSNYSARVNSRALHNSLEHSEPAVGGVKPLPPNSVARLEEIIRATAPRPAESLLLLRLCSDGGLRVGEAVALAFEDVVDANGNLSSSVRINQRRTAKGRSRSVPITRQLGETLRKFLEQHSGPKAGPIFTDESGMPLSPRRAQRRLSGYFARAGLSDFTTRSLRRTFICHAAANLADSVGAPIAVIFYLLPKRDKLEDRS
jgi:integrase